MTSFGALPLCLAALLGLTASCRRAESDWPPLDASADSPQSAAVSQPEALEETQTPAVQLAAAEPITLPSALAKEGARPPKPSRHARMMEADALFTNATVLRISIDIPRAGLNVLRRAGWGGDGQKRPVAKVTVTENGVTYTNVALHLKGAAGSFRPVDDKPAMTLNFDTFAPGQSFHGLNKMSLNNSVQDPTFLCEKIARELFLAAGVPVPRAAHALVTLNGRDLGLYVLLEGANKQFLKRHFANASGNLYDGGFCQDLRPVMPVNSGDNPQNHSGLRALIAAVREQRPTFERLDKVLDTERFLSMVALEMLLGHWDGYTLNRNNWRVFHDLQANRMVFVPHGLDQLFGGGRHFDPASPIAPQHSSGDAARALLSTREGQRLYRERIGQLCTNLFTADRLLSRVDEITTGVRANIATTHPQLASFMQRQANRLKQRINERIDGVQSQMAQPPRPLEFGADRTVRLDQWKPTRHAGDPTLAQTKDPEGIAVLSIQAGAAGTSSSSWRTRVTLPAGRYQFKGRLRADNVVIDEGDDRGGAGLRISGGTMPRKLTGTSGWTEHSYDFTVEEELAEVVLVCELRAAQGEARFDVASLRLVRSE